IAVEGISLTVAELVAGGFTIAIIPHTLEKTNLLSRGEGAKVNLETDLIGKYVQKFLSKGESRVTEDFLAEHGFFRKR
ncbi:partial riboflavin synthase, partial [uncultured bacterium]